MHTNSLNLVVIDLARYGFYETVIIKEIDIYSKHLYYMDLYKKSKFHSE